MQFDIQMKEIFTTDKIHKNQKKHKHQLLSKIIIIWCTKYIINSSLTPMKIYIFFPLFLFHRLQYLSHQQTEPRI